MKTEERRIAVKNAAFRNKFDPERNLELCASMIEKQLEVLLSIDGIGHLKSNKSLPVESKYHKKILKLMIRVAGESDDYLKTVDFVSNSVLDKLSGDIAGHKHKKFLTGFLDKGTSHEHIVPCEVIYQLLLDKLRNYQAPKAAEIKELLCRLSYRALITPTERGFLDGSHKSTMPSGWDASKDLNVLARYCEARDASNKALIAELVPVTDRGKALWNSMGYKLGAC